MKDRIIAVDIGGSHVRIGLCDLDGRFLERTRQPTRVQKTARGILDHIANLIRQLAPKLEDVLGIGVGTPGPIDPATGTLYESWNVPELNNTQLKPYFESQFCVPVFFGNDAHLAALGEHRYGAGRGVANMIYMTISTGIGGGIIVDNKRLLGARGLACEVGEQVFASPVLSMSRQVKSLENLASGPNIAKQAVDSLSSGRKSIIRDMVHDNLESVTAEIVARAAREGDAVANEVLSFAGFCIGLGLVNLIHIFNPELIVLGGGVMNAGELILKPIRETVDKYALVSMKRNLQIVRSKLADDAGLFGAAALVMNEIERMT